MLSDVDRSTQAAVLVAAGAAAFAWCFYQYVTYDYRWWWKRRSSRKGCEVSHQPGWERSLVHGHVKPGWERVREEFVQNFRARGELGAAVCVYHRGEKVVDLWGGYRDGAAQLPWERDTLAPLFSTTKGVSAFALHMLASRGDLKFDDKVVDHWPEFGENGKKDVTVRELIDHGVGLAGISPPVTLDMLRDDKKVVRDHIARARMEWPRAGDYKGYMAMILGFYESAIVQMTDGSGRGRTIGQYLREEAFEPLGIADEIYIGLPDSVPDSRLARLDGMSGTEPLWPTATFPDGFITDMLLRPGSYTGRAFRNPELSSMPSVMDYDRREVKRVEIPAGGGQGTARAVAAMYSAAERAINTDGRDNPLGLSGAVREAFLEPAKPGRKNGWMDEVLRLEACMGAGFVLPAPEEHRGTGRFLATPGGFGTPGARGSFGYCDPAAEIAYTYVMNRCGQLFIDDPREFALRKKMYEAVHELRKSDRSDAPGLDLSKVNVPHFLTQRYSDMYPELAPLP